MPTIEEMPSAAPPGPAPPPGPGPGPAVTGVPDPDVHYEGVMQARIDKEWEDQLARGRAANEGLARPSLSALNVEPLADETT